MRRGKRDAGLDMFLYVVSWCWAVIREGLVWAAGGLGDFAGWMWCAALEGR